MELIEIEPLDTLDHLVSIILLHWVSAHFKTRKYMHFFPPITQIFSNMRSEEFTGHNLISNRTCRAVADKQPVQQRPSLPSPHTRSLRLMQITACEVMATFPRLMDQLLNGTLNTNLPASMIPAIQDEHWKCHLQDWWLFCNHCKTQGVLLTWPIPHQLMKCCLGHVLGNRQGKVAFVKLLLWLRNQLK